ncbi:hypothetical protein [Lichenicoccus sp.]|uniref:hypothetical protein n=1 Tax=Lichenicoccus sp. TaxID=2781899 RepID=UPI003D11C3C7
MRDVLTVNTRRDGTYEQVRALLSPAGREFIDAMGAKIDREMVRLTDAERHQVKLHGARELADMEVREGPIDPAYARKQAAEWELEVQAKARAAEQAREAARASAPLLPA